MREGARLRVVVARGSGGADGPRRIREALPGATVVEVAPDAAAEALTDADAVVCGRLSVDDTARATRLRLVQSLSTGADRIDRAALPPGCALCNVHGHETAIGEWVLGAMIALTRRFLLFDRALRRNEWHRFGDEFVGADVLYGKTVGTIGFGAIGRRVAEVAPAFGMDVVGVTRNPSRKEHSLRWLRGLDALPELLDAADFAVVAVPGTDETHGLIGERELELLGPRGYLLNVARGSIVDERALYEALRGGRIAGAAIDTWWNYPQAAGERVAPSQFDFASLDNVLMTPHTSGRAELTSQRRWQFVAEQLARLSRDEPLENVLFVA